MHGCFFFVNVISAKVLHKSFTAINQPYLKIINLFTLFNLGIKKMVLTLQCNTFNPLNKIIWLKFPTWS
jgi:hypothetical protein